ncbi:MAG: GntR family transcriptional regulator [Paenibacillaceae bacterium]|nr:GntR family transcriptional regulator [Paenibacillaceae bacterium]
MQKLQKSSLGGIAKDEIMKMIITGKLKPGDRLKEVEIAETMGISRIPVREALLLLEQEGFIESGPYKNNIVAELDYREIVHIFLPIRRILETYALRHFIERATEEQFAYLEYQIRTMEWAIKETNLEKYADADIKFHECLFDSGDMKSVASIWSSISNRMRMYFFASARVLEGKLDHVVAAHEELLRCMRSRDYELAEQKLLAHIDEIVLPAPDESTR